MSKSLPLMVEVEMVSRLVVWPRIWKMKKPSSDNIGLYFLPHNMQGFISQPVSGNRRAPVPVYRTGLTGYRWKPVEFKSKFK